MLFKGVTLQAFEDVLMVNLVCRQMVCMLPSTLKMEVVFSSAGCITRFCGCSDAVL